MSGGLMLNKVDCGCVYQAFRDYYGSYDKDSISRFIICKLCRNKEEILTDDEVDCMINDIIDFLKTELDDDFNSDDKWFSAAANLSLCFLK